MDALKSLSGIINNTPMNSMQDRNVRIKDLLKNLLNILSRTVIVFIFFISMLVKCSDGNAVLDFDNKSFIALFSLFEKLFIILMILVRVLARFVIGCKIVFVP